MNLRGGEAVKIFVDYVSIEQDVQRGCTEQCQHQCNVAYHVFIVVLLISFTAILHCNTSFIHQEIYKRINLLPEEIY